MLITNELALLMTTDKYNTIVELQTSFHPSKQVLDK